MQRPQGTRHPKSGHGSGFPHGKDKKEERRKRAAERAAVAAAALKKHPPRVFYGTQKPSPEAKR
jgi:hypothetical protein